MKTPFRFATAGFTTNLLLSLIILTLSLNGTRVNAQSSVAYGYPFDLSKGATAEVVLDLSLQGDNPRDLTFNNNGYRLYTVGSGDQEINQYNLTTPYDLSTATFADSLDVSGQEMTPEGIAIRNNGLDIYMVGIDSDTIYQYTMTTANNLSTATLSKKLKISDEQLTASDVAFNNNGTKMYVIGFSNQTIHQYDLSTAFDITTAVVSANSLDLSNEEATPRGMFLGDNGNKLFVAGSSGKEINQYTLSTAYDISTASHDLAFNIQPQENGPQGVTFRPNGTEMFVTGMEGDDVTRYSLNAGGFTETAANSGTVAGDLEIRLTGETFTNAGGTLTFETDYTIKNSPEGLVPTLSVAADGLSALLTYTGTSVHHFDTYDIKGLIFTFENSAFTGGDASVVANATNKNSNLGIDYLENPVLTYGKGFDFSNGATQNTPGLNVDDQQKNPQGSAISPDGTKFYVTGGPGTILNKISQYSLATPFDITNGVTYDGQIGVGAQDEDPTDIELSPDGRMLFMIGTKKKRVHQYELATPFDVTGTVTHLGFFSVDNQVIHPNSMAFSTDGKKMFVLDLVAKNIKQYTLHVPFDVIKGGAYDASPFSVESQSSAPQGIHFNATGTRMFISTSNKVFQYRLSKPYDVTSGVIYENVSQNIDASNSGSATGMVMNEAGSKLYFTSINAADDFADQYTISFDDHFTESAADDGSVTGSAKITIAGDTFVNANGALDPGLHYNFSNLPAGLIPSMAVSANGLSATLTFSGNAIANREVDGVSDLQVTFTDAAFTNSNASEVVNAINAPTGSQITFTGETTMEIQSAALDMPEGDFLVVSEFIFTVVRSGDLSVANSVDYAVSGDVDAADFFNTATLPSGTIDFNPGETFVSVPLPVVGDHTIEPNESFTVTLSNPTNQVIITNPIVMGTILNDDNTEPVLVNPISDLTLDGGFITHTIDLTNVFSDADGHTLTYIVSGSNPIVTLQVVNSELRITEGSAGTTTITVTADDGFGGSVIDEFVLTVTPSNTIPVIQNPIADEMLIEGFGSKVLDLSNVFSDADGDVLTLSVSSDNSGVITAGISGTSLTLTEVANGSAIITVTADDGNGGTVSDDFNVTITALPNTAPVVANPIADQNLTEGFTSSIVDLSNVFSDVDNDVLTLSATSSNSAVATVNISANDLTITEAGTGTTTITVTADDGNGGSVADAFEVTITSTPNTAPVVANPISDQNLTEGFTSISIELNDVFSDADNDALSLTATSGNAAVATISVSGNELIITETGVGTATITVSADDGNGGSASDDFEVSIATAVNSAPTVGNAIADQNLTEGFSSATVDLNNVFSDADNDALSLTATSSNTAVATVSISGNELTVTEAGIGTTTVTVTADDGRGGSVADDFLVSISAAGNNAPVVANPIVDQSLTEGFASTTIDLAGVFTDADNDALTLTSSSSDETVVIVVISGTTLTVTESGIGTATITINADDSKGGGAVDAFDITVTEKALGLEDTNEIRVYPNPASHYLMIRGSGVLRGAIYDGHGKIIKTLGNTSRVDVSKLKRGVYMMRFLTNEGNTIWRRFIKE